MRPDLLMLLFCFTLGPIQGKSPIFVKTVGLALLIKANSLATKGPTRVGTEYFCSFHLVSFIFCLHTTKNGEVGFEGGACLFL